MDTLPAALAFAQTPAGSGALPPERESDLPLCRLERGEEPHLRFVSGGIDVQALPTEGACFTRLRQAGALVPTPMPFVFEVTTRR